MLDETGRFEFTGGALDLVERLWRRYQEVMGSPADPAERLAGLAFAVAALRQDVEAIWQEVQAAPELEGVSLTELLNEQFGAPGADRRAAVRAELRRRGWLST